MSKNKEKIIRLFLLTITLFSVLFLPINHRVQAQATGLPFGGRLLFFTPVIVTAYVNCPALAHVINFGPGPKYLNLFLPPTQPKTFYNFYTPGVAVLGSYYPFPITINCPFQPIFPSFYFGTSGR